MAINRRKFEVPRAGLSPSAERRIQQQVRDAGEGSLLSAEVNDLTAAVTWDDIPDANVPESAVTQHEAALTITESQISDLNHSDLQEAYDFASSVPQISVNGTPDPLTIDATVAGDVFAVRDDSNDDILRLSTTSIDIFAAGNRLFSIEPDPTARSGIEYMPDGRTVTAVSSNVSAVLQWDSLVISDVPGGAPFGNDSAVVMVAATGEAQFNDQGGVFASGLLFNQATVMSSNGANIGPVYTMVNQPRFRNVGGGSRTMSQSNAVRSQMKVGPNTSGNATLTSHESFFATIIIDATVGTAACTAVNYFAPKAPTLTAGGTIGTLNVMDIPNIPATGITTLRGINSAMSSGTFINHTGSAAARFGGEVEIDGALNHDGSTAGFYGTAPTSKPTVTGSRGGNAALESLLTALAGLGLITDNTT